MKSFLPCVFTVLTVFSAQGQSPAPTAPIESIEFGPTDWPWWRGPNRDGVSAANQRPPAKWSAVDGVLWKTAVPGRGHGSVCIVGDRVFLMTADPEAQVQGLVCLDRSTGKQKWFAEVHKTGLELKGNAKTSLASGTPACDGRRVFVNFLNGGFVYASAFDLDGKKLWQTKVSDLVMHQGFGASPAVYGPLVIVTADHKGGGKIAGLDRRTGSFVWSIDRPKVPNYTSAIIHKIGGKDQLIMTGCDLVTSLDPLTGKTHWETKGATTECVTSTVTDGKHVFTSGGYPKNHLSAVSADGSGKVVWENNNRVYVPSLVVVGDYLYGVLDAGVAACWKCDTGKEMWKGRLGGTFSSSPVVVGDQITAVNESGRAFTFKPTPEKFDLLSESDLGGEVFATPVFCGDRIYLRVADGSGKNRREFVYCWGDRK